MFRLLRACDLSLEIIAHDRRKQISEEKCGQETDNDENDDDDEDDDGSRNDDSDGSTS